MRSFCFFDTLPLSTILSKKTMLYIPNNRAVTIKIPRISAKYAEANTLRLTNTIDHTPIEVEVVVMEVSALYYTISVTLPHLQSGEYRYELMQNKVCVSLGLAIVEDRGEFNNDFNIAFKRNNTYGQNGYKEEYIQYHE